MSRSRVAKYATKTATAAGGDETVDDAPARGSAGLTVSSAAAAPYIPRPKNAEWPNDTMPV